MGQNDEEKVVVADEEKWNEAVEADPSLSIFKKGTLANYDKLHDIFGTKTAQGVCRISKCKVS